MKAGWQKKILGELLEVQNGFAFDSKAFSPTDGMPLIRIRDLKDGVETETRFTGDYEEKYIVKAGDFLIGMDGEFGCYEWKGSPALLNQRVCRLQKFATTLSPRFLFYGINSHLKDIEEVTGYSTVKHLSSKQILGIKFLFPPLPEQQRIVGILDEAFEGIATAKANAEKNVQNARALFQSHLNAVFTQRGEGWGEDKLKALTTKIGSGATPLGGEKAYKTEGISLIRSLNVHDLSFRYEKLAFIDDMQSARLSNVVVEPNDVLLNITGASVARCCVVPEAVLPARVNQHVSIIRTINDKLDAEFLHFLLISKPYKERLLQTGEEGGSTRQAITKAQIKEFKIYYPKDLQEQQTIVAKLDGFSIETQLLESIYQQKIAALDELKQSLLHQAFSGNL